MIYQLNGKIVKVDKNFIVIDINGIGIKVLVSKQNSESVRINKNISLHTHLHVREDILDLYGFISNLEREIFLMLINVNGIGPKLALTILSGIVPKKLKEEIVKGDVQALTAIPGVGAKTAKRIIIELKEKFMKIDEVSLGLKDYSSSTIYIDALNALNALGYNSKVSKKALNRAMNNNQMLKNDLENLIKESLKNLNI